MRSEGCTNCAVAILVAVSAFAFATVFVLEEAQVKNGPLAPRLRAWRARGDMVDVFGYRVFTLVVPYCGPEQSSPPDFVLVHGFPSSSFDYSEATEQLCLKGRVVVWDHLGFGFSDKPSANFSYSLHEHAEVALKVLAHHEVRNPHIVAHDMGDSVVTEMLARRHRGPIAHKMPIRSVTFTNGGMLFEFINFRVSQRLLMNTVIGPVFNRLVVLDEGGLVFRKQIKSLSGTRAPLSDEHVEYMRALLNYNGGNTVLHRSIYYLHDRQVFEPRWFEALRALDVPCRLVWGDSDSVSPLIIPRTVEARSNGKCALHVAAGLGHFLMLEDPSTFVREVTWAE